MLDKPSDKPIPGLHTQVIGRIPHLQEMQLQGPAHMLSVHPLSSLSQEFIIWLKMLLFFEELKNRLWHKNEPFLGYRIKTQIYHVPIYHLYGDFCDFCVDFGDFVGDFSDFSFFSYSSHRSRTIKDRILKFGI